MNLHGINTTFPSILGKALFFLALIALLASCEKDDPAGNKGPLAGGYSILVNNGNVLVSGFRSENGQVSTKYWINGESVAQSGFTGLVGNYSTYRQAVDEHSRTVYTFKDSNGAIQNYQFDQGSPLKGGKIFYYKNDSMVSMNNDSLGTVSSVAFHDGQPYFAGYLKKITSAKTGDIVRPLTPFVWDGNSSMALLLPEQTSSFQGVSTLYIQGPSEFYVGGLCGIPMYWKNTEPILLDQRYGEVWQITKSGSDVYAVGLINKYNSNSTGHTACYWKNGELYELEDRAQAFGIFVNGDDIYVSGAVGNVPANYKPCYWKNGVRVDLPM